MTTQTRLLKRRMLLVIVAFGTLAQTRCGYVAAGAVGAAVGHEAAERENEEEDEGD